MAIEFVRQWSHDANHSAAESFSFPLSPSPTSGNLIVAVLAIDKGSATNLAASGYTKELDYGGGGAVPTCAVFYKTSDGTETSIEFTWTTSEEPNAWAGEYSGVDNSDPWDVTNSAIESSAVQQCPNGSDVEITTTVANTFLISMVGYDSEGNANINTDSWTGTDIDVKRFSGYSANGSEVQIFIGEGAQASAATVGTRGNTSGTGDEATVFLGALQESAGGPVYTQLSFRGREDDGVLTEVA